MGLNSPHLNKTGRFRCPSCDQQMVYIGAQDVYSCWFCSMDFPCAVLVMDKPLWITREKQIMLVCEMETSHLQFSINKILNSSKNWRHHMMPHLLEELRQRKEKEAA